jgi:hypothetical protein
MWGWWLVACGSPAEVDGAGPPGVEQCAGFLDEDDDGEVDCLDADCAAHCDADGDGVWNAASGGLDCDDADPSRSPNTPEICNGRDDDCDVWVDDADPSWDPAEGVWQYEDGDGDGYGQRAVAACTALPGHVAQDGDCDDAAADAWPGAAERCDDRDTDCDGLDDNLDPDVDPATRVDSATDLDGDGWGDPNAVQTSCDVPAGRSTQIGDCDDADPAAFPGARWATDADGDGFGDGALAVESCLPPSPDHRPLAAGEDCDDANAAIAPGAVELCWDGVDQDCTGLDDCHPSWTGDALTVGGAYAGEATETRFGVALVAGELGGAPALVIASDQAIRWFGGPGGGGATDALAVGPPGAPALGDVDGDGQNELVWADGSVYGIASPPSVFGVADAAWTLAAPAGWTGLRTPVIADGQLAIPAAGGPDGALLVGELTAGLAAVPGPAGGRWDKATVVAGDLTGDGWTDWVVAAPDAQGGAGEVRVYDGAVVAADDAWLAWTGVAGERFGALVALGDGDGDGAADLAIGRAIGSEIAVQRGPFLAGAAYAPELEVLASFPDYPLNQGVAFVADGTGDGTAEIWVAGAAPLATAVGWLPGDASGTWLAADQLVGRWPLAVGELPQGLAAVDLDADGYLDVALGAPATGVGTVYLIYGSPL